MCPFHHHICTQEPRWSLFCPSSTAFMLSQSWLLHTVGQQKYNYRKMYLERTDSWNKQEQRERWKQVCAGNSMQQWSSDQMPSWGGNPCLTKSYLFFFRWLKSSMTSCVSHGEISPAHGWPAAHRAPPTLQAAQAVSALIQLYPQRPSPASKEAPSSPSYGLSKWHLCSWEEMLPSLLPDSRAGQSCSSNTDPTCPRSGLWCSPHRLQPPSTQHHRTTPQQIL